MDGWLKREGMLALLTDPGAARAGRTTFLPCLPLRSVYGKPSSWNHTDLLRTGPATNLIEEALNRERCLIDSRPGKQISQSIPRTPRDNNRQAWKFILIDVRFPASAAVNTRYSTGTNCVHVR